MSRCTHPRQRATGKRARSTYARRGAADGGGGSSSSSASSLKNDADASAPPPQQQQHQQSSTSTSLSRLAASLSRLLGTGSSALLTALVCLSWMSVSSVLILLNKHLLATGFHYPMALSCLGMLFSSVAAFFCCRVTNIVEARRNAFSTREYLTRVMPGE